MLTGTDLLVANRYPSEAATGDVYKRPFLKISQYSQESTCLGVSF